MAEERKTDPALDDWDSLPLDPAADDWDAPPARPAKTDEPAQAPPKGQDSPPPVEPAPAEEDDFDDEAPGSLDSLLNGLGAEDDDLDTPLTTPLPEVPEAEAPKPPPAAPKLPPPPPPGAFDAFLGSTPNSGPAQPGPAPGDQLPDTPPAPDAESQAESPKAAPEDESLEPAAPLPPKVELDIEGIFLEEAQQENAPEPAAAPEDAPEPNESPAEPPPTPVPAQEPPPPEAAHHHKVPILKLLILVAPALLILTGLGWFIHRLFIYTPPPPPEVLVIDPAVPAGEPEPGELPLKPFYINFAGTPEVIVEMSVTLYYNNVSDRELIEENLPSVREVIFRITRGRGSQVVTNGGLQRALRQELLRATNEALGAEAISYVQLTQFRILH